VENKFKELITKINEFSEVIEALEKLTVKLISLLGWVAILVFAARAIFK